MISSESYIIHYLQRDRKKKREKKRKDNYEIDIEEKKTFF